MGRPQKEIINSAFLKRIEKMAGYGLTVTQIADLSNVGRTTFYQYMKNDPRVAEHLAKGQAQTQMRVSAALVKKAEKGDINAIKWYEMTRANRNPALRVQSDPNANPAASSLDLSKLSDEELLVLERLTEKALPEEAREMIEHHTYEGEFIQHEP